MLGEVVQDNRMCASFTCIMINIVSSRHLVYDGHVTNDDQWEEDSYESISLLSLPFKPSLPMEHLCKEGELWARRSHHSNTKEGGPSILTTLTFKNNPYTILLI